MSANNKPSYKLIPVIRTPSIDPGDEIEISVFVDGYGMVDKAHLHTVFDHPDIVNSSSPGRAILSMKPATLDGADFSFPYTGLVQVYDISTPTYLKMGVEPFLWTEEMRESLVQQTPAFYTTESFETPREGSFSSITFSSTNQILEREYVDEIGFDDDRDLINGIEGDHPPMKLELETLPSKTSSFGRLVAAEDYGVPGDYEITFTLTYGDDEFVYQDQSKVTVHVNGWVERHTTVLQIIAIFLATVAALAAVPSVIESFYEIIWILL